MSFIMAGAAIVSAGVGVAKFISGKKAKKKAEAEAEKARAEMEQNKAAYMDLDTSNPYKDYQSQLTNVYEDMTVNQQQAEFQKQQQEQQRANIMQNLQGAAGGSGIAALAQQMASEGSLQAQEAAASIGAQESQQQQLKARGEQIVQEGREEAMGKRIEGDIMSRDMERNKIMTLMGMSQQETAAYNEAAAKGQEEAMSGLSDIAGAATSFAGGVGKLKGK